MNLYDLHPEPQILKGYEQRFQVPEIAFNKAIKIWEKTKKRSLDLEPFIAKDSSVAYLYAENVIQGKWPEGEPAIAKSSVLAYAYATDVLHKRFPLGEPAIAKDLMYKVLYQKHFKVKL